MRPLALDLSLTGSGWAAPGASGTLRPPRGTDRGMPRLAWIRDRVLQLVEKHATALVVIEGYAYGKGHQAHQIGELGGVVRLTLSEAGVPLAEVPPASLKRYATGRGNAGKAEVLAAAIRRLGYLGSDDNEADALWLLQMAMAALGMPEAVDVPKSHAAALQPLQAALERLRRSNTTLQAPTAA